MKKKFAFIVSLLIFVPFVALAQYTSYDHIVGCDINTIPKFIKATLALFIRVGVPIGALFLIWAGFLYFTAQGNESKLASAKKNFVWASIGLGILFGAWLFAYAFQGVVNSFSGGVSQDATTDPCGLNNLIAKSGVNVPATPIIIAQNSAPVIPPVNTVVVKAPTQVLAQAVAGVPNQILLSWAPSQSPDITGYNVYQNGNLVGTTAGTSFQVSVVNANLGYSYTIVAINSSGVLSPPSAPLSTSLSSLPGAPANTPAVNPLLPKLTATIVGLFQVNLSWTAVPNATGYTIKRNGTTLTTTTGTTYSDMAVSPGSYSYTVTAMITGSASLTSTPTYVFVRGNGMATVGDTQPPTVPTEVKAIIASSTQVNLSWKASTDNVDLYGYNVYRNGVKIGYTLGTSYIDKGTSLNTDTDTYTVDAYDASGNTSVQTAPVKPMLPPPPPSTGGDVSPMNTSVHAPPPTSSLVVNVACTGGGDETAKVQAAVNQVGGTGGTVLVSGTCMVNALTSVNLKSNMTFKMASGAVLKAITNSSQGYSVLKMSGVSDVNVVGGTVQGERATHTGTGGEYGMCVDIRTSSRIFIESVIARDCWGDGFYIGGSGHGGSGITLSGVVADNNRRDGLSLISGSNIYVVSSAFQNTNGTAPQHGIDVEPNDGDTVNGAQFSGNQFSGNRSEDFGIWMGNGTMVVLNVTFNGKRLADNTTIQISNANGY